MQLIVEIPQELKKLELSYDPAAPLLCLYWMGSEMVYHRDTCIWHLLQHIYNSLWHQQVP